MFLATASQITRGDRVTYCGETFRADEKSFDSVSGLIKVTEQGKMPQFIAPEREVQISRHNPPVEKPFVVLTRDYDAKGNKDVRRFTFKTQKQQSAFISRTSRCITFTN